MVPEKPAPPLRVCFFNRTYAPDFGSTGQLLTELAEDLAQKHRCEVTVICGVPTSGEALLRQPRWWIPVCEEQRHGVRVLRAWGTRLPHRFFPARVANYLTYFAFAILAGFRASRPQVVVTLTDPPIVGLAALWTSRRSGARFVFLCEDLFPEVARLLQDFRNEALNRLLHRIYCLLVRRADRVIALGETMRKRLISEKGASPDKLTVIHNWADCAAIIPASKRNPFSEAHGLVDRFVVMHSGNIGLSQGLESLIEAAAALREHSEIRVVLVGEGVKRAPLEMQSRALGLDNVLFLPYQPKDQLRRSFAAADLFVVSLKVGLSGCIVPSKVYGILAAGRPFIAAVEEDCEAADIARRYDCGLCARVGDPADLADKILALYRDPALARRLGENARKAALRFDRPVAVSAYHDLFRNLVR